MGLRVSPYGSATDITVGGGGGGKGEGNNIPKYVPHSYLLLVLLPEIGFR
jgi:hypothetical protein